MQYLHMKQCRTHVVHNVSFIIIFVEIGDNMRIVEQCLISLHNPVYNVAIPGRENQDRDLHFMQQLQTVLRSVPVSQEMNLLLLKYKYRIL